MTARGRDGTTGTAAVRESAHMRIMKPARAP